MGHCNFKVQGEQEIIFLWGIFIAWHFEVKTIKSLSGYLLHMKLPMGKSDSEDNPPENVDL